MYSINRSKTAVRVMTTKNSKIPEMLKGFEIKTVRVDVGDDVFLWTTADTDMKMGYVLGLMDANGMTKVPVAEWTEAWKAAKAIRDAAKGADSESKSDPKKKSKATAKKKTEPKAKTTKKATTKKAATKKATKEAA